MTHPRRDQRPAGRGCFAAHSAIGALLLATALLSSAACQSSSTNVTGPSGTKCAMTLPSSLPTIGAGGGSGTLTVTVAAECVWSASSAAEWVAITSNASGQGTGTLTFAATGNPSAVVRRGALIVGERRVELTQAGAACQFTLAPQTTSVPAAGGDGAISLNAVDGCQWSASSQAEWLAIVGNQTGSGSGTIRFAAAANDGPSRSGLISIADRTFAVNQAASGSACAISLDETEQVMPAAGGTYGVTVTAPGDCTWTAASQVPWITVAAGASGRGTARVTLTIAPNTGGARVGLVTIGGQTVVVSQGAGTSSGCSYSLLPTTFGATAAGGATAVAVTAPAGCAWTATSMASWITIATGAVGNGSGAVTLAIAANTGGTRSGSVMIAGLVFTVTQGALLPGCSYSLSASERSVTAGAASTTVDVSAGTGCAWTASSQTSWITIASGAAGAGSGTVGLSIATNIGGQRSGTATIAGHTVTVTQVAGSQPSCSYDLNQSEQSVAALGGPATIGVNAGSGCAWTATSQAPWITIAGSGSGSGNGTVTLAVALNAGSARSGAVTIAGRSQTINQASGLLGCSYALDSTEATSSTAGGTIQVAVTAGLTCGWQSQSNVSWISVASGANGLASGTVRLAVAANSGAQRTGTVTIAGQTFTVTQAPAPSSCTYTLNPTTQAVGPLGGDFTVAIATQAGCTWTATTPDSWIQLLDDRTGAGSGSVTYRIGLGLLFSRSGRITISGQSLTVNQAALLLSNAR